MTVPIVLVPLDGSKGAQGVLPIARRLAALTEAHLQVTEAAGPLDETAGALGLIVMATAVAGPSETTSETMLAVLRGAACPVVLVDPAKAAADWDLGRMVALHDGSPAVSQALVPAAELARMADAEFVVLQVATDACAEEAGSIAPPAYVDQVQYSWPGWSAEYLHRLASICSLADVRLRLRLAHGEPAEEVVRGAREESADLIVMAWSEATSASALQAVLQGAPCPVMVTRPAR